MSKAFDVYLDDIEEAVRRVERYTAGLSYDDFRGDELVQDGVCRNLGIIGEAVKRLPRRKPARPRGCVRPPRIG